MLATTCPPSDFTDWWYSHVEGIPNRTLAVWCALPEGTRAELLRGTLGMFPAARVFHRVLVAHFVRALSRAVGQGEVASWRIPEVVIDVGRFCRPPGA